MKFSALTSSAVDAGLWALVSAWLIGWNIAIAFADVAFGRGGKAQRDLEGGA